MPDLYFVQLLSRLIKNTYDLLLEEISSDTLFYLFCITALSIFRKQRGKLIIFRIIIYILYYSENTIPEIIFKRTAVFQKVYFLRILGDW